MHIGVDLGGTKTECIILDQKGKEIERLRKETPKNYYGTCLLYTSDAADD